MSTFADAVTTFGDPSKPPIVFLHGIRLGGKIWEPHARELCDTFFVVTPDLPGHGALADRPFDAATIDALLAYIACHVVSRPPLLVGYSLGGYVAARYAIDLPDQSRGLVLSGSSTNIVGYRRAAYAAAVRLTARIPPAVVERLLTGFFHATLPPRVANVVIPFPFNQRVFEQSFDLAGGIRYSDLLVRYHKPLLVINGKWDLFFRQDEREYARLPGARLEVMPGSDHVAPLRRPREFSRLVRAFAEELFGISSTTMQGRSA